MRHIEEVTYILNCNTFRTTSDHLRLDGILSLDPNTPQSGIATDKFKRLILGKHINYKILSRDEYGRAVAQVWFHNTNVNTIMREYIMRLPHSPFSNHYIPINKRNP